MSIRMRGRFTSNWTSIFGKTWVISRMNSSMNSVISESDIRLRRRPRYMGSSKNFLVFTPTSRQMGIVDDGRMLKPVFNAKSQSARFTGWDFFIFYFILFAHPAPATYSDSFPPEMGAPLTPRSPRPSMREPLIKYDFSFSRLFFSQNSNQKRGDSPSVTTVMRASSMRGQERRTVPILPLSLYEMN
jgi:hypothetical protein